MKTLVVSDTHLSLPFEEKKYDLLKRIIEEHDRVIINGDFWEGYFISFNEFITSQWSTIFPLLKRKNSVYIFGNHDLESYAVRSQLNLFSSVQTHRYHFSSGRKTFCVEHGDEYVPLGNVYPDIQSVQFRIMASFWNLVEETLIRTIGTRYQLYTRKYNNRIKSLRAQKTMQCDMLICGHTHAQEIDEDAGFANSGVFKFGLAQYLTIENGIVTAHSTRY